jgi:hypothetical protein
MNFKSCESETRHIVTCASVGGARRKTEIILKALSK